MSMEINTGSSPLRPWYAPYLRWEDRLYEWLGDEFCGNVTIPGTREQFEFKDENRSMSSIATTYNNDGFELWLGTDDKWHTFIQRDEAHRFALWVLFVWWGKGEWFGLKRWAWYKLLHRRVNRWKELKR